MKRVILLADMNSFFASVHQSLDKKLRGRSVVVCGDPATRHGIVLSASYEAKAYGVKTGMTVWEARSACPQAVIVKAYYPYYIDFSSRILRVMYEFTPLVEPFSIDEAFLDITGSQTLWGNPLTIAHKLKNRIYEETKISCSVGIGPNKLLAKMAAGLQKPNGLTVLCHKDLSRRLWPLPIRALFGVGPRYECHLKKLNIHTIGDLAQYPVNILKRRFGVNGEVLWLCANGIDATPVDPESLKIIKSMGQQITLPRDYRGEELKTIILELADLVSSRVRFKKHVGKTVVIFLKDSHFSCLCRRQTLPEYTNLAVDIAGAAFNLLSKNWSSGWPVRMLGLVLTELIPQRGEQTAIFGNKEKIKKIEKTCDLIRNRYGKESLFRAVSLKNGLWGNHRAKDSS